MIRRVRPEDWEELIALVGRLSPRSRRMRFFSTRSRVPVGFAKHMANVDFVDRCAFVAVFPGETAIRAVGRYERPSPESMDAEVAFVVEDALHGYGIAPHLLAHLRLLALENRIETFSALVLGENDDMISLFRNAGMQATFLHTRDIVTVRLNLRSPGL